MAQIDVKITDLEPIDSFKKSDLFLVSKNLTSSDNIGQTIPYTSNALSGGALFNTLENQELHVHNRWQFEPSTINGILTQNIIFGVSDIANAIRDNSKRQSMADLTGWYVNLSSNALYYKNPSLTLQSLSCPNNSIPNIDFVQRLAASLYNILLNTINNLSSSIYNTQLPSYVGMIIHSTTLTNETAVRNKYGTNTRWILHSGYFLRGASSGVSKNSTRNDGGQDSQNISTTVGNHTHTVNLSHSHSIPGLNVKVNFTAYHVRGAVSGSDHQIPGVQGSGSTSSSSTKTALGTVTTSSAGGSNSNTTISMLPKYKNVYIWERVS